MSHCLNLTRSGEYALAALARLVLTTGNSVEYVPVQTLADHQGVPKSFLRKILGLCLKKGILAAKSGPLGGIRLAKPAGRTTLLEIFEACEGTYGRESCVFYPDRRCAGPECQVYCPLRKREEEVRRSLARTTLVEMSQALKNHPNNK